MHLSDVRITVLVDNSTFRTDCRGEHGLSLWIETPTAKVLFDTGFSSLWRSNAKKLGVDVSQADFIVISHGHADHTGGLAAAAELCSRAKLVAHPEAFTDHFSKRVDKVYQIGMPRRCREAAESLDRILMTEPAYLAEGLLVTGPVPRTTPFEEVGGSFWLDRACTKPDSIEDDLSLVIEADDGLAVITGCAHAGVVNICQYARQIARNKRIATVIGGMHLSAAKPARLAATAEAFDRMGIGLIVPMHCTGPSAASELYCRLPGQVRYAWIGDRIDLGEWLG